MIVRVSLLCVAACLAVYPAQAQWLNYRTPAVPRTANGKVDLAAPTPKAADGKPDLSGVWETKPQSANSTFRQVFMDRRPLPKEPQPTWLGYSVARWEGATLMVDTIGFNGRLWLDTAKGHPQTADAHVTERFTRRDLGHLEIDITIDDSGAYEKPWRAKVPVNLGADTDLLETFCEDEKDQAHKR